MNVERLKLTLVLLTLVGVGAMFAARGTAARGGSALDDELSAALAEHGFTGRVGQSLEERLGRKVDNNLAELGRLAFHDSLLGLADDKVKIVRYFSNAGDSQGRRGQPITAIVNDCQVSPSPRRHNDCIGAH